MSQWSKILNAAELAAYHARTAQLDPLFAAKQRAFYEGRTADQLDTLTHQAWEGNNADTYQLARSYRALLS